MSLFARTRRPLRPVLTLRLGVTGHRPGKLPASFVDAVTPEIDKFINEVHDLLARLRTEYSDVFATDDPVFRVVSPVAEGADRLVARESLKCGAKLLAPLPFHREIYARDFATRESVDEYESLLDGASAIVELDGNHDADDARNRAYERIGRFVVDQCDVLLALWDGAPAAGLGGAADIVAYARTLATPVLWFPVGPEASARPKLLVGDDEIDDGLTAIMPMLERLLKPPAPAPAQTSRWRRAGGKKASALMSYFDERNPRWSLGDVFTWFRDLSTIGHGGRVRVLRTEIPNFSAEAEMAVARDAKALAVGCSSDSKSVRLALQHAWSDGLSNYYSGLHRSAYVCNYILAALAIFFAAVDVPIGEFSSVVCILALTTAGSLGQWHRRWIDYRSLAEKLRTLEFLRRMGAAPVSVGLPQHLGEQNASAWTQWLFAASLREAGIPSMRIDAETGERLRQYLIAQTEDQAGYHEKNAHRLHHLNHRLHVSGTATFVVSAIIALVHVMSWEGAEWVGITLPAVGAAVFGIRSQGEFERVAARSENMARVLDRIAKGLRNATKLAHATLVAQAQDVAEIMLAETSDWQIVMAARPLGLPA